MLVREVLAAMALTPGMIAIDGTVGAGGHAAKMAAAVGPTGRVIGVDRDPLMLRHAAAALESFPWATVHQASHSELRAALDEAGVDRADAALLDLGLSSDQLADDSRGFGFRVGDGRGGGPLDLRFDVRQGRPAAELLADDDETELTRILTEYGEHPRSAAIAAEIVRRRASRPIRTAVELADLVEQVAPAGSGSHPATRIFQALRIAVNDELGHVERTLADALPAVLKPGGRAAILTFHSLEDRLVKQAFVEANGWRPTAKKPTTATPSEVRLNPRARSAKLRAATRITA
ncbi:16S rRNA (cytosine(1402)-N(4))-methyltransferase RsmH [Alienimonas chondri]|uniref:16S rRNA (cytosine(1402)-N(4))-methyltransferase RsmH n=1 Tax=Alienimonas chondri TaxID=2681879 RepID=UPI0028F3F9B5|nr:16S rRNA (cytosine(1402)-N(4))-methyltransferase RsmH [Alienimonas chondri]